MLLEPASLSTSILARECDASGTCKVLLIGCNMAISKERVPNPSLSAEFLLFMKVELQRKWWPGKLYREFEQEMCN